MNLIPGSIDLSAFTEPENVHQIRSADRFKKKTIDILSHKNKAIGCQLPWHKAQDLIELRPGELSIWTGYKGHGKSMMLSQAMLHCMKRGQKVLVLTPELSRPA